jgi:hypothetical protein
MANAVNNDPGRVRTVEDYVRYGITMKRRRLPLLMVRAAVWMVSE